MPRFRARAVWALAALVMLTGFGLFGLTGVAAVPPVAVAVVAMIVAFGEPAGGRRAPTVVGGAAVLSVAYTIALSIFDQRLGTDGVSRLLTVGEILAMLLALLVMVVRAAPRWAAATAVLCAVAVSASVLRFGIADRSLTTVLGCVVWSMSALGVSAAQHHTVVPFGTATTRAATGSDILIARSKLSYVHEKIPSVTRSTSRPCGRFLPALCRIRWRHDG